MTHLAPGAVLHLQSSSTFGSIFGLATKESSHPSMMATSRLTTSAVPSTADIAGQRGHVRKVPISDIVRSVCNEKDTEPLLTGRHGAMSSMSKRLVNLIRCIFRLLAFASPRAAGIILSSRAASAAIIGTYSPVAALA